MAPATSATAPLKPKVYFGARVFSSIKNNFGKDNCIQRMKREIAFKYEKFAALRPNFSVFIFGKKKRFLQSQI